MLGRSPDPWASQLAAPDPSGQIAHRGVQSVAGGLCLGDQRFAPSRCRLRSFRFGGAARYKQPKFALWDHEGRTATIQANRDLGKDPHDRLISIFESGKMESNLTI